MPSMTHAFAQITKNIPKEDRKNPTIAFPLEQFEQQFEIILALEEQKKTTHFNKSYVWPSPGQKFPQNAMPGVKWLLPALLEKFRISHVRCCEK